MRLFQAQIFRNITFVLWILAWSFSAQARVFSFANESVAPYFNVRGGLPSMSNEPYRWQSAAGYSGDEIDFVYGGEFGIYLRGGSVGMALGILVDTFQPIHGGRGENVAGQNLYSVNTEGIAFGPSLNFDYQLSSDAHYLWKLVVGGGYKIAKMENTYSLTAAGQALNGGAVTATETYTMLSPFATFGIAAEFFLSGSATMNFLFGYHLSLNNEWKYRGGGQNFAGVYSEGSDVLFEDGTAKMIHWSYPFLQVGFHFYIDTLR